MLRTRTYKIEGKKTITPKRDDRERGEGEKEGEGEGEERERRGREMRKTERRKRGFEAGVDKTDWLLERGERGGGGGGREGGILLRDYPFVLPLLLLFLPPMQS